MGKSKASAVRQVVDRYGRRKRSVIPILRDIQDREGWLTPAVLDELARELDIPPSQVMSLVTFYKSFRLEPRGRHVCTVCMGTACHVRGGAIILEHFERRLGIPAGKTSADGRFTLERVNCLGACALAPLVVVDGRAYGLMTEIKADAVLKSIKAAEGKKR